MTKLSLVLSEQKRKQTKQRPQGKELARHFTNLIKQIKQNHTTVLRKTYQLQLEGSLLVTQKLKKQKWFCFGGFHAILSVFSLRSRAITFSYTT